MGSMNFPDPNATTEHDGWDWDSEKWVKNCSASGGGSGGSGGSVEAIASGALATGDTVIVNADGTVSVVDGVDVPKEISAPKVFSNGEPQDTLTVYDPVANRVVICYRDDGNPKKGAVVVGAVSGDSITFGTPLAFNNADTRYISAVYDSASNKIIISYTDNGNSSYGTAIVGTVSGDSISFGTSVVFNSGTTYSTSAAYDPVNNKVVIACRNAANSNYGEAIVGSVSGDSISFGTAVVFTNSIPEQISTTYDPVNNKVIIAYGDDGNSSYGTAVVGAVSGDTISFGTPVVFSSGGTTDISTTYDSTANKVAIVYRDSSNSDSGTAIVGTVSEGSITFGTSEVFNSSLTNYISCTYDEAYNKVVIAYGDYYNSRYGTVAVGTVSGDSISFGLPEVFNNGATGYTSAVHDPVASKVFITYGDTDNSGYGTAVTYGLGGFLTNLTGSNYIGTSSADYADGDTATIQIAGSVSKDQSGLTAGLAYYVQPDGSLGTSGNVFAGTAVAPTNLIVKG